MTKIKHLHLTKKVNETYLFDCTADLQIDATTSMNGLHGYDLIGSSGIMELIPALATTRLVNFDDNFDIPGASTAKTHNILFYNGTPQILGKISVRDGNYPPPYTASIDLLGYNQPAFSAPFEVSEMTFTENDSKYDMMIKLVTGNGMGTLSSDKIQVGTVYEENGTEYEAILIGVPPGTSNTTITFNKTEVLDENRELAIVIVSYTDAGGYNIENNASTLMKKGVVKLN